ncbi:MBL fold metallo-hydrolase [Streptomyces sp. NPDC054932]
MASLTLVKLLFCGQGMTKLIEIYDKGVEKPDADYLALVDCGGNDRWSKGALDYIAMKVAARSTNPKCIDLVVLSHQDGDHVALLGKLGERLKDIGTPVRVGQLFIGGTNWKNSNQGTVRKFLDSVGYDAKDVKFNEARRSDYENVTQRSDLRHLAHHEDVYFRVLVTNLCGSKSPENASSSVLVVENGAFAVVLPGDATYETMDFVDKKLGALQPLLLPPVVAMELPHHGALATAVKNYESGMKQNDLNWSIIQGFAAKIAPRSLGASAGPWNKHCHPVQEVIEQFYASVRTRPTLQWYVSYVFYQQGTESEKWRTWLAVRAIETTVQRLGSVVPRKLPPKSAIHERKNLPFVYGDIVFKIAPPGVLRPEEMVEFRPRGTFEMPGPDEPVVQAPEP